MIDYIVWTDKLSVGDDVLDSHHREIFDILNSLYGLIQSQDATQTMDEIWQKLENYSLLHFSHEEKVMDEIGFPLIEEHRRIHQTYIREINLNRTQIYNSRQQEIEDVFHFLKTWWKNHIRKMDMKYSAYLAKSGER
ncbi:MAG: bacteriohemerythrin [Candidatus Latescibacteria bacterium]|nr:bacteriohemerythrin [bacterium]MBD3423677.1 bacteriohemerythrin [Candidatus Latescibacterota bacterium]